MTQLIHHLNGDPTDNTLSNLLVIPAPILTSFEYPPIPIRSEDWRAWFDGREEEGPYGSGETEAEAVEDLIETWAEREER